MHSANTMRINTERELSVANACPSIYGALAAELRDQLSSQDDPPTVVETSRKHTTPLLETTTGKAVALRVDLPARLDAHGEETQHPIALFLPKSANLTAWFRAFLSDIHQVDPSSVPHEPPRLSKPSDWYTPTQRGIANGITEKKQEIEDLEGDLQKLQEQLGVEGTQADNGIRRAIWLHGTELVGAVSDLLSELGFSVQDMDAIREPTDPKVEDLRLTLPERPNWEAIVEVKGYANGVKTNDSRQINDHVKKYIAEKRREPDLIVWLTNPFRHMDPSSRPVPDSNVEQSARGIDAVHVLSTDLYRQWSEVGSGAKEASEVVNDLTGATPGLWNPSP